MRKLLLLTSMFIACIASAQSRKVFGRVTNSRGEPVSFATVQIKEYSVGNITKEDGSFELNLDEGKYDIVFSMIGYKIRTMTIIIRNEDVKLDVLLEQDDATTLSGIIVKGKYRDKAEDHVRMVIQNKGHLAEAAGAWSCNVYIKAFQEDSTAIKKSGKKNQSDSVLKARAAKSLYNNMAFAEVALRLDRGLGDKTKEVRTGVHKKGNPESLFFLSTTDGDFNLYSNLISVPAISATPFISPVSYSGLLAYRFRTIKTETINGQKFYTIGIKPRQLSNATVEGEITIADSTWVVLHARFTLPKYHLTEYDFFEIEQDYVYKDSASMLARQQLTYQGISEKKRSSGITLVTFKDYELQKQFPRNYFGTELSAASKEAYERDSNFWKTSRTEPLTPKEIRFIYYKDSVYQATHTKVYLDSLDSVTNKVTWQNLLYKGQEFNDHIKQRRWTFQALPTLYQPVQFGGSRLMLVVHYNKRYENRKQLNVYAELSYGLRNKDINGTINISKLYNPFKRGYYHVRLEKSFEAIFRGDAWINMIKRNNVYLHQAAGLGHSRELLNGLYLFTDVDIAFRSSVSNYRTNNRIDSLFGNALDDNRAVSFPSYTALYGEVRLEFTPQQRYIREPKEKVMLGSSWPTLVTSWRKGIPGPFKSTVDFDYLEFGVKQTLRLGVVGISSYSVKSGAFFNHRDLRLVDYKFQRRGDPFLFMNPNEAFQSLDSTFPVFRRFYETHFIHEFNGAILNKIPLFKKLGLREIAGAGFLYVRERNLTYAEVFTGIERVFKYPFHQLGKFKLGVYVVGSAANQFRNPVQFKIGITTWDRKSGKWF